MQKIYDCIVEYILENQNKFYRLAYSYVHNREDALDIVQNAVCKALENYHALRNQKALKTWFYRILVNEALILLRKEKKEESGRKLLEEQPIDTKTDFRYDRQVYEFITCLSESQKTVMILHYYEGFTLREIAKITDTNLSTVKSRLYSGLKKLKVFYQEVGL